MVSKSKKYRTPTTKIEKEIFAKWKNYYKRFPLNFEGKSADRRGVISLAIHRVFKKYSPKNAYKELLFLLNVLKREDIDLYNMGAPVMLEGIKDAEMLINSKRK